MDPLSAPTAPSCHFCEDIAVRNISIDFLKAIENGALTSELLNATEIATRLDLADKFEGNRTLAHRKSKSELFHNDSAAPFHADTLCGFCRHMDLKRLCAALHNYVCEIVLGSLEDLRSRRQCTLCAFLVECIVTTFPDRSWHDTTWTTRSVYLRFAFDDSHIDGSQGVKIHLCVSAEFNRVLLRACVGGSFSHFVPEWSDEQQPATARLLPPLIDWKCIGNLVANCAQQHPGCLLAGPRTLPSGFRLIDIEERKVMLFEQDKVPAYLALSYVWGKDPDKRHLATKETIKSFECVGGLSDLPETVEDCFQICRRFRTRYLWVDGLCIVQDDYIHKMQQINVMDIIYRAAELVIIAASASHVKEGLSGIRHSRKQQLGLRLEEDNLDIVAALPRFDEVMEYSPWQSRGWTYQEAVLGRRKLYLTSTQAFYECGRGRLVSIEDDFAEGSAYGNSLGNNSMRDTLWQYYSHIDQYNRRSLTDSADVYNAIHGILKTLYPDETIAFGLPMSEFDQALLWRGPSNGRRPVSSEVVMPSWSWVSTNSSVKRWRYLFLGALVSWSVCITNNSGELEFVQAEAKSSPETWVEWKSEFTSQTFCPQLAMAIAWKKRCMEAPEPFGQLHNKKYTIHELQTKLSTLWPSYRDFWNSAFTRNATMTPPMDKSNLFQGTLLGRVQLKKFLITRHEGSRCIHKGRLQVECPSSTEAAGMLEEPHPDLKWIQGHSDSLYLAALSISEWQLSEKCFDWIPRDPDLSAVSPRTGSPLTGVTFEDSMRPKMLWYLRANLSDEPAHVVEDNREEWSLDTNIPWERPPLLVNVMLLDIDANGESARCVCKGWMFLTLWCRYPGEFRTITISPNLSQALRQAYEGAGRDAVSTGREYDIARNRCQNAGRAEAEAKARLGGWYVRRVEGIVIDTTPLPPS